MVLALTGMPGFCNKISGLTDRLSRYYWDFAPGYSYVDVATSYDRATFVIFPSSTITIVLTICHADSFMIVSALASPPNPMHWTLYKHPTKSRFCKH